VSGETVIGRRDGAGLSEDFELLALRTRSCNELEFDAGAEPDALSAECGLRLRRDRVRYNDPSETVCSRGYKIVEDCRPLARYTDNRREYTHHQTKRRMRLMRNRQSLHYPPQVLTECGRLFLQRFNINSTTDIR
jgi:hypothetical protein